MLIGHVVQAATHRAAAASTLAGIEGVEESAREIERLRTELAAANARIESLKWVLRVVRREIDWGPDSPTLRLVDQSIAGGQPSGGDVERARKNSILRSV